MVILKVRQAQHCDRDELARMRLLLWPDGSFEEHLTELDAALNNRVSGNLPATIFVSHNENGALLGFIEVGLWSYADGCDPAVLGPSARKSWQQRAHIARRNESAHQCECAIPSSKYKDSFALTLFFDERGELHSGPRFRIEAIETFATSVPS
jgi:hypothetical protein